MDSERAKLVEQLREHYASQGWPVEAAGEGALLASGPGGVTWIGLAVTPSDLDSPELGERLVELAGRRMDDGGELCPLDLLPDGRAAGPLRELLERLGLSGETHVSVYSPAGS